MSKEFEFIKNCGTFFVLTVKDGKPVGRPFGAIMEHDNNLYIATADTKAVYQQLIENPSMQLLALKTGTREWGRISGLATECKDLAMKQKMLIECPILKKHYHTADASHYNIFKITVLNSQIYQ